ncbi:hypothetical protein E2C01_028132 [Portunus trituberculatus]|uniref:Synaptojanin-1/2 RNA recognition motif domain-containing protein n=1 Tax=Portunus trituberculatus TaxID=210409 RepID=A0A5B7EJV3_PORTR|nr:hypothetical protein [Portunus trituberculatus]
MSALLPQSTKTNVGLGQVCGQELEIRLKTEAWREQLDQELALCGDTTAPLIDEDATLMQLEDEDPTFSLRNMEGALEELYLSQAVGHEQEEEEENEVGELQQQPSRIPPSRPTPSRPPPPRPTPPGSTPSSPAPARPQAQGPKVKVLQWAPSFPPPPPPLCCDLKSRRKEIRKKEDNKNEEMKKEVRR